MSFQSHVHFNRPCASGDSSRDAGVLAQLQRAHVRGDRPAIAHRNLRGVVGHRAEPVRDDVEDVSGRRLPKPIDMERRRPPISALHDHAVAFAGEAVARRTEDVVALAAAPHQRLIDGKRKHRRRLPADATGVEQLVLVQVTLRDRAFDGRARGALVGKEIGRLVRRVASADRACPAGRPRTSEHQRSRRSR